MNKIYFLLLLLLVSCGTELQRSSLDLSPETQEGFLTFPVWAEENGNLSANNDQWSFGNGSTGPVGLNLEGCSIYAMSFDPEARTNGTGVTIALMVNNIQVQTVTFDGTDNDFKEFADITINRGDVVGFRTISLTGTHTDCRVAAWCKFPIQGIEGPQGPAGNDGIDGVGGAPNAFSRITVNTSNINQAAWTDIGLNAFTLNTIGATIVGNDIQLDPGTYELRAILSSSATAQRPNQEIRMLINGAEYSSEYGENYIRSAGGHNEAKLSYTDIFTINATSTITIQTRLISITGTVTLDASRSKILLHKIA